MNLKKYCEVYLTDIVFKHNFDFKGRAGRKVFWLFALNIIIFGYMLSFITDALTAILYLAVLLPHLGLIVRRIHDINLNGWWVLVLLVPILGNIAFVVLGCIPGTEGENKYGSVIVDVVSDKVEETTTEEQK